MDRTTERDSMLLYNLCCDVGVSSTSWRERLSSVDILTTCDNIIGRYGLSVKAKALPAGSMIEGLTLPALEPDVDVWAMFNGSVVVENEYMPASDDLSENYVFTMFPTNPFSPAYFNLHFLDLISAPDSNTFRAVECCYMDEDNGTLVLPSAAVNVRFQGNNFIAHGPSLVQAAKSEKEIDLQLCLHCITWPSVARQWEQSYPSYNWPSIENVNNIVKEGCELVAVGNPVNAGPHLEWRLSFSVAERILIRSFNEIQVQCFFLMKLVLLYLIRPRVPGTLSSYHMKNLMFHAIEHSRPEEWTKQRLPEVFLKCLHILKHQVEQGFCPEYFIPQNNLFNTKVKGEYRMRVLRVVRQLENEGWRCLLRCPPFNKNCNHPEPRCLCFSQNWHKELSVWQSSDIVPVINAVLVGVYSCLQQSVSSDFVESCDSMMNILQIGNNGTNIDIHFPSQDAKCLALSFLRGHFGFMCLNAAMGSKGGTASSFHKVQEYGRRFLSRSCDVDVTSVRLKMATFLYQEGKVEKCLSIVRETVDRFTCAVLPWSVDMERMHDCVDLMSLAKRICKLAARKYDFPNLIKHVAFPVVFSFWELLCAPFAVQYVALVRQRYSRYDRKFDKLFFIDSSVYAYYLCVISFSELGRDNDSLHSLQGMRHIVQKSSEYCLFYKDIAMILLRWCENYVQTRHHRERNILARKLPFW